MQAYVRNVARTYAQGNATELTYRSALEELVESLGRGIRATNEPRRVACGAPDLIVERRGEPIGYIECKDIGVSLDTVENSGQLKRYLDGLEHLILTDYLEFRYYVAGEQRMHAVLARVDDRGKVCKLEGGAEQLAALFDAFLAAAPQPINTPKELAKRMADVARMIDGAIRAAFGQEDEGGTLHGEYEAFRQTLLHDLTREQFADMYAQTVCYGLFSARVNVPDHKADAFTRRDAAYDLPKTNPFLRQTFDYIAGTQLHPSVVWAVEELVKALRRCVMTDILKDFGKAGREMDPVVHFYETFLREYDPNLRKTRGVYYTPEPVVGYIVRSVDAILKRDFGCTDGLADRTKITAEFRKPGGEPRQRDVHRVQILDPAAGTGTFLFETVRHIRDKLEGTRGAWAGERGYVAQHLLPRLFGFELMMAPYAVAHMKLGWLLKETGYDFAGDHRLGVYLTNTLEEAEVVSRELVALAGQIAREANAASEVKTDRPIMVVLGNPPYSGHSANDNDWSKDLIHKPLPTGAPSYFECDGEPLGERNPKWLNDDYVKFIRFGQYRIERTGYGILAFITNNGYLDNPTFRGMRQSLMQTFDDIYVLDLHGSTKKKETAPDGSADENVFDIMQGVGICIMVRRPHDDAAEDTSACVHHADLYGKRQAKHDWLNAHYIASTDWQNVQPTQPFYLFKPQDRSLWAEYEKGWKLTEAMPLNGTGVITKRDFLSIHMTPEEVWRTVTKFAELSEADAREHFKLPKDVRDWHHDWAKADVLQSGPSKDCIKPILYRPFDVRKIYYTGRTRGFIGWPVVKVMRHMLAGENLGLLTTRQTRDQWGVLAASAIAAHKSFSAYDITSLFPLYVYRDPEKVFEDTPWPEGAGGRRPNLAPEFVEQFAGNLGLEFVSDGRGDLKKTFGPEDVFHYAYAVFHAPTYRERYAAFLKIDFPRLPLTSDSGLFATLCGLGEELVGLHLLERVPEPTATYPVAGPNEVTRTGKKAYKPPTDEAPGRVYISDAQYFEPVPPEVWEFHVGGYQVCQKWLKDRKGRTLSYDDIETYRKITEAIGQTIRLMGEIDQAIPGWPIE